MQPKFELDIITIQCEKGSTLFKGDSGRLIVLTPDSQLPWPKARACKGAA